jgi:hypothetical protein
MLGVLRHPAARRAALVVWCADVVLIGFAVIAPLAGSRAGLAAPMSSNAVFIAFAASYAGVGALISTRRQENPIGWIFLASGTSFAISAAAFAYADYGLAAGQSLPGVVAAVWIANCISPIGLVLIGLGLVLFPDGTLPGPGWRPVLIVQLGAVIGLVVGLGLMPGSLDANVDVPNPLGISGASTPLTAVQVVGWVLQVLSLVAAGAAITVRLRRSEGVTRLQLKWVAYATSLLGVIWLLWTSTFALPRPGGPTTAIELAVATLALVAVPVAAGVAILRHHLFEIDVIIRKTLVYASLVAVLAALYVTVIALLGRLLQSATGQSGALAVTVSTLVVAGAFQPVRGRIQRAVDRRFYRRTLDSAEALQAFAGRMRDQVDLDSLQAEVLAAVQATVQPHHASLWLRPAPARLDHGTAAGIPAAVRNQ